MNQSNTSSNNDYSRSVSSRIRHNVHMNQEEVAINVKLNKEYESIINLYESVDWPPLSSSIRNLLSFWLSLDENIKSKMDISRINRFMIDKLDNVSGMIISRISQKTLINNLSSHHMSQDQRTKFTSLLADINEVDDFILSELNDDQ